MSAIREVALEKEVGELQAEVARLRELISDYYRLSSSEWIKALKAEARAALRGGGE